MTDADTLLRERFAALANPHDDSDWLDVRRRSRRRRRVYLLPVAAAVAALAAASALAVERDIADFFRAEPAPERVVVDFGRLLVHSDVLGGGFDVVPREARKVLDAPVDGRRRPFFVAPTESGGFC